MSHPPDTQQARTAIHEAGHLTAAWFCTAVTKIDSVKVHDKGGNVQFFIDSFRAPLEELLWCGIVIALAGLAAEVEAYGKTHTRYMRQDLNAALKGARRLAKICDPHVAFPTVTKRKIGALYSCPLLPEEAHILEAAYKKARVILKRGQAFHFKAIALILANDNLSPAQLHQALGPRIFLPWEAKFVLPQSDLEATFPEMPRSRRFKSWAKKVKDWFLDLSF